jgi:REP element-mobilizing transposase RayT
MTTPGSIAGSAAPQCGISRDKTEDSRSGERRSQGWYSRGYLPHFDSPHAIQHITYRLADSLPQSVLEQMQAELKEKVRDKDAHQTELRRRIETYLDAGHGSCVLQEPEVAACVVDTWLRFDGERYCLLEWVVMPNHCHVMIEALEGILLGKIVLSWKNYTARWINEYKRRTGVRRSQENPAGEQRTQIWHREYWDRFIRDERHFVAVKNYIAMNPVNVGLVTKPKDWPWSSAKDWVENGEK